MTIQPISLSELLSLPHHTIDIQKGEYIFQEGEAASELYVVCTGKVQLSKTTDEGRELLLRICEQGDAFGEIVPFQPMCVCTVSAKMMEAGKLAVINKQQLEKIDDRPCVCVAVYAMDSFTIATDASKSARFNFARKKRCALFHTHSFSE